MNENIIIINCPSCNATILIDKSEINCKIFRHGVMKESGKQIDPHLSKDNCDKLVKDNRIYGCGKPFKLEFNGFEWQAMHCEYI